MHFLPKYPWNHIIFIWIFVMNRYTAKITVTVNMNDIAMLALNEIRQIINL